MDSVRKKLIREVLDSDSYINARAAKLQIQNMPKQGRVLLQSQLNNDDIQKLNLYASTIKKYLNIKQIYQIY